MNQNVSPPQAEPFLRIGPYGQPAVIERQTHHLFSRPRLPILTGVRNHKVSPKERILTRMFELTEQQLTWEIVGKWTAKDTDLDYSIIVKHQPMTRMDTMIGSSFHPSGKPYRIHLMYFLKGYQLFIATLRSEEGAKDFESKSLIDLTACSLMTEPSIARQPPRFLSVHDRASYFGERFFFHSRSDDLPPYQAAFTLRFPERSSYYAWEEAMKFSNALKRRIHKSTQQGEQADAGNRRSAGA